MQVQNNNQIQEQSGNSTKPLLPAVFLSTTDKREKFLSELKELLVKYKAELNVNDYNHFEDRLVVEFNYDESFFEKEGTGIIPDIDLGRWEDGR